MSDRPNLLLILTDQQSATMMSCAGNPWLRTPAMDSLAAEGVRFERAYCSNSVCIASRFSLFTGRFPSEIGLYSNFTAELLPFGEERRREGLGWLLRDAGYAAFYGGKVHLPRMKIEDLGFEVVCRDERDALAAAGADFLRRPPAEPFCLVVSFINPHDICYMAIRDSAQNERERRLLEHGVVEIAALDRALARPAGVDDAAFFRDHAPPLPANFAPQADEPEVVARMLRARPFRERARREWPAERWREHRWAYARLTEFVDAQIGVVLDALRESGRDRTTLTVFTSDHGDMDGAHGLEHKSTMYEEAARVPLIVRPPGGAPPRTDGTRGVSNGLDLLPTLCDFAGAARPAGLPGRSLRPLIEGARGVRWRAAVPMESAIGRAVRWGDFKYARYDFSANGEQLYDLARDPGETRNCAADPDRRAALAEGRRRFERAFAGVPRDPVRLAHSLDDA